MQVLEPAQPHIQWAPGFFPEVKRPWREVNHTPPSSAEVKNEYSYTSTSPLWLYGVDRENSFFLTAFYIFHFFELLFSYNYKMYYNVSTKGCDMFSVM
jgi:hypothetical protein